MRLNCNRGILAILVTVLFLASCQKELSFTNPINTPGGGGGGTGNNNIIGDWNFVGMTASTNTSVTVTSPAGEVKAVTISSYVTKNNTGTVKITATDFISTNLSYEIDTTMNVKTYLGGILVDDMDLPFAMTAPLTSSTSPYTRINNDSLTTTGAFGVTDPTGGTPTGIVGIKLGWSGDTLLLKVKTSFTQNISQGGIPGTLVASVNGVTKLKRR